METSKTEITEDDVVGVEPKRSLSASLTTFKIERKEFAFMVGGRKHTLGEGSQGNVCKGNWLSCDVAVKVVPLRKTGAREVFMREADLSCRIRHPCVESALGWSIDDDAKCAYLLMELRDGGSLADALADEAEKHEDKRLLSSSRASRVLKKIAQALHYLHHFPDPIIHRDLKLENVLVSRDFKEVRVCDFGISFLLKEEYEAARAKSGDDFAREVTSFWHWGTPYYSAPEASLTDPKYSPATDIYSFGCVAFHVLVAQLPRDVYKRYRLPDIEHVLAKDAKEEPVFRRHDHLLKLIGECLAPKPKARPSALQCLQALEHCRVESKNQERAVKDFECGGIRANKGSAKYMARADSIRLKTDSNELFIPSHAISRVEMRQSEVRLHVDSKASLKLLEKDPKDPSGGTKESPAKAKLDETITVHFHSPEKMKVFVDGIRAHSPEKTRQLFK